MSGDSVLAKSTLTSGKNKQDIRTPRDLFQTLNLQFHFTLDPCDSLSHPNWLKIPAYNLDRGEDGLENIWYGNVFINPPWNNIFPWIYKAEHELKQGNCDFVVMLIPSKTETKWFHHLLNSKYLMKHTYLKSRIHFVDQKGPYIIGMSVFVLWRNLF